MKTLKAIRLAERKLNISVMIDATCVARNKAGVGVYARNLIHELAKSARPFHLYVLIQDDDPELELQDRPNLTILRVPSLFYRKLPLRLALEQLYLPLLLRKLRIDILHSLHYSFPLVRCGTRQVVTIHDMTSFKLPSVHLRVKLLYFRLFIRAASRVADEIIFVSNSARTDFFAQFRDTQVSSTVTHLGKDARFCAGKSPESLSKVRAKYGLPPNYLLYVGTIEPRKNLVRLIRAVAPIAHSRQDFYLVLAGMKGWMYEEIFQAIDELGLEERIILTGFVAEDDKPSLIAGSTAFVYPSLYEGFGIPVLEALACGIPTITSNVGSLPEIAGDAAILVDPYDVSEIHEAILNVLDNQTLRRDLCERALRQSAGFSWAKTATETLAAYARIASCCH